MCPQILEMIDDEYQCDKEYPSSQTPTASIYQISSKKSPQTKAHLKIKPCSTDEERTKAEREFAILGKLKHPNLLRLFSSKYLYAREEGVCCFIEESTSGETLANLIARKNDLANSFQEILKLTFEIARALKFLKRQGVVHCDLNVANVLVSQNDSTKLVRFDDSVYESDKSDLREPSYYTDPVVLDSGLKGSSPTFDFSVDVYGLGVVLYELTFRRKPFEGNKKHQIIASVMSGSFFLPHTNPLLAYLIFHMMSFSKENRPTIEQVLEWIIYAARRLSASQNDEKRVEIGLVKKMTLFPPAGWEALGMKRTIPKRFVDLKDSGLLDAKDPVLGEYLKNNRISQRSDFDKVVKDIDDFEKKLCSQSIQQSSGFFDSISNWFCCGIKQPRILTSSKEIKI